MGFRITAGMNENDLAVKDHQANSGEKPLYSVSGQLKN